MDEMTETEGCDLEAKARLAWPTDHTPNTTALTTIPKFRLEDEMARRSIFTILTGEACQWAGATLPAIRDYAARCSADLVILDESDAESYFGRPGNADLAQILDPANRVWWLKFLCIEKFCDSDYDSLLYLDIDVEPTDLAPDIFASHDLSLIHMATAFSDSLTRDFRDFCDINGWPSSTLPVYFQGGILLTGRKRALALRSSWPSKWSDWLGRITHVGSTLRLTEQVTLSYFVGKQEPWVKVLSRKWNNRYDLSTGNDYFIHYAGERNKEFLRNRADRLPKLPRYR